MAADPNPALRAELLAARGVLDPEIRGLHDLALVSISAELKTAIQEQITVRERRVNLVQAVIEALDRVVNAQNNLEADGYPELPDAPVPESLLAELREEHADVQAAVNVFASSQATNMSVKFGAAENKPA